MQVQRIQNNNYNTQFRGTLDKSVEKFVVDSVKSDCRKYVNNLETSASTKVLKEIKTKWMETLNILRNKAASMHKDTTVKVVENTKQEFLTTETDWILLAENSKLNRRYVIKTLDRYNSHSGSKHVTSDELKGFAENINPQTVDRKLSAAEKAEILDMSKHKWYKDEEVNSKLNNVIEYQKEIGENDSEELIKIVNENRAKIKAENLENEQQEQMDKKNSDILNKFFEENL